MSDPHARNSSAPRSLLPVSPILTSPCRKLWWNPKPGLGRWFTYWKWPLLRAHASFQVKQVFPYGFSMDILWYFLCLCLSRKYQMPLKILLDSMRAIRFANFSQRCDRRGGWGGFSSFFVVVISSHFYTANKKIGDITDIYWYNP